MVCVILINTFISACVHTLENILLNMWHFLYSILHNLHP
uniref:Uncharacterized protein n=1 Tax=Anguilla anguilla TaxID=7936 RepID=A0A0E9Q9M8_ANGAN